MKRRLLKVLALLVAFAVGGLLVAASGIISIKASARHWPITDWFLHFAMRRSVVTHTLGVEIPPLNDPQLVLKGAGHYESGCRPCHGGPDLRHPTIAGGMTPHPPDLTSRVAEWEPEELFYIVKHGVKFTGMPAWPTQHRDDEVWAMVAFLMTLPALDPEEYRRLVHGESNTASEVSPIHGLLGLASTPHSLVDSCARCHGVDGRGRGGSAFPKLAGQRPAYLASALHAYAQGRRHSGIMQPIAANLGLDTIWELAQHYASLPKSAPVKAALNQDVAAAIERGKAIAAQGIRSQRVPACARCHGPGTIRRNPHYPVLAGQYADYLVLQLTLFKNQQRGGSAYGHLMLPIATRLTQEQMRDVALYYESLTPALDG